MTDKPCDAEEIQLTPEELDEIVGRKQKWVDFIVARLYAGKEFEKTWTVKSCLVVLACEFSMEGHPITDPEWIASADGKFYEQVRSKIIQTNKELDEQRMANDQNGEWSYSRAIAETRLAKGILKDINDTWKARCLNYSARIGGKLVYYEKKPPRAVDVLASRLIHPFAEMDEFIAGGLGAIGQCRLMDVPTYKG
jgi:hypothetical protein